MEKRTVGRNLSAARSAYLTGNASASTLAHTTTHASDNIVEPGHDTDCIYTPLIAPSSTSSLFLTLSYLLYLTYTNTNLPSWNIILAWIMYHTCFIFYTTFSKVQNHRHVYESEKDREVWELSNYAQGEKQEMIDLYSSKGMSTMDATRVINIMAKYETFFIEIMMLEELGKLRPLSSLGQRISGNTR